MNWPRIAWMTAGGVLGLWLVVQLAVFATNPYFADGWGADHDLYMEAARRAFWTGDFYEPWQVAGPYEMDWGAIMYPPVALLLFVPAAFLPWPLWYAVPIALTVWMLAWHRPALWAWVVIIGLASLFMRVVFPLWQFGNPTIWLVAFLALATRWPWVSAFILAKPTLLPFALLGIRDRRWWWVVAAYVTVAIALLPQTLDWIDAVTNARGPLASGSYTWENVPAMLIPLVAWVGGRTDPLRRLRRLGVVLDVTPFDRERVRHHVDLLRH